MNTFELFFSKVISVEGGYVFDSQDPGGETKYGISKRSYPKENIKDITLDRAKEIYYRDYWMKCRCNDLPTPLDGYVFDAAVNQGVHSAIILLQRVLESTQDGLIGPETLRKAKIAGKEVGSDYLTRRIMQYTRTEGWSRYGVGWVRRVISLATNIT